MKIVPPASKLQRILRAKVGFALCFSMLLIAPVAFGQDDNEWKVARSKISELARQGKCSEEWDLLWHWAKSGQLQARTQLGMAIHWDLIFPPGLNQDLGTLRRHKYTFMIHALLSVDLATASPEMLQVWRDLVIGKVFTGGAYHPVYDCLSQIDRRVCTAKLVTDEFVADFDTYARELDVVAKLPGARPATCGGIHR